MTKERFDKIVSESCDICGCGLNDFFSDRRTEPMYMARSLTSKYLSDVEGLSLVDICLYTKKKRDIVARQIRCFDERMKFRKDMTNMLNNLKERMKLWTTAGRQ